MFDQVLQAVKQQLVSDPKIASAIPGEHADEVHKEVATSVTDGLKNSATRGGIGNMISSFTGSGSEVGTGALAPAILKAVEDRLNGKFGLSYDAIQSIKGAIPGILQKFTGK